MGIDRIGPSGPSRPSGAARARTARDASTDRAELDTPRDRIDLSPAARDLAAAATPEDREALLQRLRGQVQDGTYRADADAIAQRIVEIGDV